MRKPLKKESFAKIKALGVPIQTVLDIGILTGTVELIEAFPDKKHFLVEPITEWNKTIKSTYAEQGIDFLLVNVAASNFDGTMSMETGSVAPGLQISHARLTDRTAGHNVRTVPVRTLDSLLMEHHLSSPFLLKIDVDGAEILIMEGARETLKKVNVVVIEANIKNFIERSRFLEAHNFQLFDIVDPCYYDDRLRQFDLVFLNTAMVDDCGLDMYNQSFDIKKWEGYK